MFRFQGMGCPSNEKIEAKSMQSSMRIILSRCPEWSGAVLHHERREKREYKNRLASEMLNTERTATFPR
jgi:hypothetical protein